MIIVVRFADDAWLSCIVPYVSQYNPDLCEQWYPLVKTVI